MPNFQYRAVSSDGQALSGTLSAESRTEAVEHLRSQGAKPLQIELDLGIQTPTKTAESIPVNKRGRISQRDVLVFTS